ncbi:gamma-glutamyl-gamma-aminobutyrate hydrolase family protein [Paracoccus sp. 1_MG-2023]|uniref:type 1 glutamine amidotransferase n=1 Tax=unclassified Paracoccus (in: a-proteobacteria) TaxID=2688777 RepID=UPI001C07FD19|nr:MULTISPECIES: gamma-glutamyl-gamma-aminobutyrate hydrolase family protein [unclassified Paracoccus (in: a-proteobacteria)]MBU2956123.1 gamma-glutamyl-gamma-aminobutyrate hydrolase family protein [Paracoccus sp. C2R09]MDO6670389.1 gamma-glutamyl-gamma-aminobutyrate hydrolase family protein [Paracoccus sp. 1_MG-2023]
MVPIAISVMVKHIEVADAYHGASRWRTRIVLREVGRRSGERFPMRWRCVVHRNRKGSLLSPLILVVSSETPSQQNERRSYSGQASHESYAVALQRLRPGVELRAASCLTDEEDSDLGRYDGIIFAGSPIQMHKDGPETRAAARFMTRVFEAGVPAFGSCAGLQIAAVAAGGKTGPRLPGAEVAFAREITRTSAGAEHPMLAERPATWTAPAMHSSIVTRLPPGGLTLAANPDTPIEAAEIRHGPGIFWGVQYHPELSLDEIAASTAHQADDVIAQGLACDKDEVEAMTARMRELEIMPERADIAWQLGLNAEIIQFERRTREIQNFLNAI